MKALNYYADSWRRYRDFRGRSSRAAYWWPFFIHPFVFLVLGGIFAIIFGIDSDENGPEAIYGIAYILPSIALGVRRLHDVGRSGQWLWIALTGVGCLPLLYWFLQPSSAETSDWGDAATTASRDEHKPPQKPGDIFR
jgi:uncharacterized membrane protein YhaH (DUF805 family)